MKKDWSDMPAEMLQEIEELRDSLEMTEKGRPRNTKENESSVAWVGDSSLTR